MIFVNPSVERRDYDDDLKTILNIARGREGRGWLSHWDLISSRPTPLWSLPGLARRAGVGHIWLKDESSRSPLGSFKALGAPIALLRLIGRQFPTRRWCAEDLFAGRHAQSLRDLVVVSATDGNHGRALAAAARSVGCRCVIVLPFQVNAEREAAIAGLGAEIVRIAGNYDEAVTTSTDLARRHGWQVVSDTSYDQYEDIPRDVMQGYGILADEVLETAPEEEPCPFTHVFLQAGVGGLAAGVVSHFWERYGAGRPAFIVVEPTEAACLLESARLGRPSRARGTIESVMAGLACGEPSALAWRFLQPAVDLFMTVRDDQAVEAMRVLAHGETGDVPVVSGESGAAGLAGLIALAADAEAARQVGLDAQARVLLLSSEGATAPGVYRALTGQTADDVRAAQRRWTMSG